MSKISKLKLGSENILLQNSINRFLEHDNKKYMFYNGNGYGESGIGLAVLISWGIWMNKDLYIYGAGELSKLINYPIENSEKLVKIDLNWLKID